METKDLDSQAPAPPAPTVADTPDTNRLVRIETRLVMLMRFLGLDPSGRPLEKEPKS